ncbi:hypothetical protein RYX36_033264 [Vicia faba]
MSRILRAKTVIGAQPAPRVAAFSSRGPNALSPEILKSDVTALGINILAAWSPATENIFNILSKTFMACPHEQSNHMQQSFLNIAGKTLDLIQKERDYEAIYLLTTGAREAAFRNIKTIAECLADELINAAKGSSNSYAIKKKDEIWKEFLTKTKTKITDSLTNLTIIFSCIIFAASQHQPYFASSSISTTDSSQIFNQSSLCFVRESLNFRYLINFSAQIKKRNISTQQLMQSQFQRN